MPFRRPRVRIVPVALGALLVLAPCAVDAQHRIVRSAQLDADAEFRIWNLDGSVRVIGWDVDSVRVEADLDDVARETFLFGAAGEGGKLTTSDEGRSGVAHLVVRVPRGVTVWVKTNSASVTVNGVIGSIDVYAVTGDVHIASPSAASVYAESLGGRVHVTGRAGVVRLRTASGFVWFSGETADLGVRTVSGDVLARVAGLLSGVVETVGGTVHLGTSFRRGGRLEVVSHDGDIDLTLPASTRVEWLLSTVSGSIDVVEPLRRARRDPNVRNRLDERLEMPTGVASGAGDAAITLRTFSGDMRLRGAE